MQTETWPAGCGDDAVGLAWLLHDWGGVRFFGHTGHSAGYLSEIVLERERGFALVVLTNSVNDRRLRREVRKRVLGACLGIECVDPTPLADPPADLAEYPGRYDHAFGVLAMHISERPTPHRQGAQVPNAPPA